MSTSKAIYSAERRSRLIVTNVSGRLTIKLRDIQAVDHSDICLIKDWFTQNKPRNRVTINLKDVHYLPSGFFGMLHDIVDSGFSLNLSNVSEPIINQIWYTRFIAQNGDFVVSKKAWIPAPQDSP